METIAFSKPDIGEEEIEAVIARKAAEKVVQDYDRVP